MGKADTATKAYTRHNDIFADAFNFYLYGGKQVISSEHLHELDTTELSIPYGTDQTGKPVQKYRDVFKGLSAMEDGRAAYLLLGIENQSTIHYAAPVKNLLYDVLQYVNQVEKAARNHRKEKDYKGRKEGEFLSGFYKEDKLLPVITLIILFSPDQWDGPLSLHEMMDVDDPAILGMVPDYRIHLVAPADIPEQDFGKFHTSLGDVLTFIKYSKDKEKMADWLDGGGADVVLGREEIEVLNTCVNAKLTMQGNEEAINVCEAIRKMNEEAAEKATAKATENAQLAGIKNLIKNLNLTAEQAMAALGIPENDWARIASRLQEAK